MALHEINNNLNAFLILSQVNNEQNKSDTTGANANADANGLEQKRDFVFRQIQQLLNELTYNSSSTLNSIAATQAKNSTKDNEINVANDLNSKLSINQIDPKSISNFKSQTILCSSCYGDLFIV